MRNLIVPFLLLFFAESYSQIKLQGFVKDSAGNALELANIIAINKATSALDSYGITNEEGRFKLNLKKNAVYSLQLSYIGMKSINQTFETTSTDATIDFTMQQDNVLDAVELTYEMPVTISGDTLTYNADSFNKGTERKLEDVLENLPGVEINDDGQVEVEGKVVTKLMV
ncbi:MAG: carboxypeptidase-like regulatory domain-containing protein [Bacteroidota bacterium]|nr:carboxypeptidase-like regulatory domain-containing protein [Bacteroidota bacterium]